MCHDLVATCFILLELYRFAVIMRCSRGDESSTTMTLHYLMNGSMRLRMAVAKQEFMIPLSLVLKALQPLASDRTLCEDIATESCQNNSLGVDSEGTVT